MPYCPKCGKKVTEADNFCRGCGVDLRTVEAVDAYNKSTGKQSQAEVSVTSFERGTTPDGMWLQEFVTLYKEAAPSIQNITKLDAEGMPSAPMTLIQESNRLESIMDSLKRLPKPKEKELRNMQKNFEKALSACIKAGDMGFKCLDDASHNAKSAARLHLASIISWISIATKHYELLTKEIASLSDN